MRPFSWLGQMLLGLLLVLGIACGPSTDTTTPDETISEHVGPPVAVAPGVLRLTRVYHEQQQDAPRSTLEVPLDEAWAGPEVVALHLEAGTLRLASDADALLTRRLVMPAWKYNRLRVRMRTDRQGGVMLGWQSNAGESDFLELPVLPDGAFHDYVFRLRLPDARTWTGEIQRLNLIPNSAGGEVEITEIELSFAPETNPRRLSFEGKNLAAIFLQDFDWRLTVPADGVLDLHLGMRAHSQRGLESTLAEYGELWEGTSHGVRMRATLLDDAALYPGTPLDPGGSMLNPLEVREEMSAAEHGEVLFDERLTPLELEAHRGWVPVRVDLGAHAGQTVTLRFEQQGFGAAGRAQVAWGNPVVLSAPADADAVPVFLISCDTLRADHLSCYGYHRDTSPNLDALAAEGVLFEQAITPEPWTLSTHMSMFTGLYPVHHRTMHTANLPADIPTFPQLLAEAGYLAAGFTGHTSWLLPSRGFGRGMDVYMTPREEDQNFRSIMHVQPEVKQWLRQHAAPNTFLFYHNYDIHTKFPGAGYPAPYWPDDTDFLHYSKALGPLPAFSTPEGDGAGDVSQEYLVGHNYGLHTVPQEEREYLIALYDDCIRMVDDYLGRFFEELKALDLYERALIIVTSDHGESFDEHGKYMHDQIYDHCLRVPLIVKFPEGRFAGRRVAEQVSLVSIYPTVLEVLGMPSPATADGPSLVSVLEREEEPPSHTFAWYTILADEFAVRSNSLKLLYDRAEERMELYDLARDPGEQENLWEATGAEPGVLPELLDSFFFSPREAWYLGLDAGEDTRHFNVHMHTGVDRPTARLQYADALGAGLDVLRETRDGVVSAFFSLPPHDYDQLQVRTPGTREPLYISVHTEGAWQLMSEGELSTHDGPHDWQVRAEALPPARPEPGDRDPALPLLSLWFTEIEEAQAPAEELSEEAIEELRALGYW